MIILIILQITQWKSDASGEERVEMAGVGEGGGGWENNVDCVQGALSGPNVLFFHFEFVFKILHMVIELTVTENF